VVKGTRRKNSGKDSQRTNISLINRAELTSRSDQETVKTGFVRDEKKGVPSETGRIYSILAEKFTSG